ncbi:hypothetical protein [Bradyrhizobium tropiciagri]|uniref:hypothetical protein n=1 Tax=Bradyrhizobium tropiciagri TaxID=312253 RepID=UPI00067C1C86|nr:hypothetical protein [Bradyrhizobium tropiciagri]
MSSRSSSSNSTAPVFPRSTANAPGLSKIQYRVGDFVAFRDSLLEALPNETQIKKWRPSKDGDLALQLLEWQAYICDVLAFYNERIANESYLRTALLPESVNHLVRVLGYRPRPALGARGMLAALLSSGARTPVQVPAGLQVQSKPGPGQTPQVYEVDKATSIGAPDLVIADVVPTDLHLTGPGPVLWLAGKVSGIKAGDRLLLITAASLVDQTLGDYSWIKITGVTAATDPLGRPVTQLAFSSLTAPVRDGAQARDYMLLRLRQSEPLWTFSSATAITTSSLELAGLARGLATGSLILIDIAQASTSILDSGVTTIADAGMALTDSVEEELSEVTAFEDTLSDDVVFRSAFGNMTSAAKQAMFHRIKGESISPTIPPPGFRFVAKTSAAVVSSYAETIGHPASSTSDAAASASAVAIPHTTVGFTPAMPDATILPAAANVTVRWDWLPVGTLVPVLTSADYVYVDGNSLTPGASSPAQFPSKTTQVMLEDGSGSASTAVLTGSAGSPSTGQPSSATLGPLSPPPAAPLTSPIDVFFNLVNVSQGKTVASETLGGGDSRVSGQDFSFTKSPLTYFADPASVSGDGYSSTAQVSVNGVQWQEVRSFYGQSPTAQVFVLREDDSGRTHVTFGDGINGARLPTGAGNVVATYRFGSGGEPPSAETLTNVMTPTPGLKGFRNALSPTGGTNADSPARLRQLAPASVLTLNRVVSIDDFATVAATAPGVTQAAASFAFDPFSQRPKATIWVAGDEGAVTSAMTALAGAGAPMGNVRVLAATPVIARLTVNFIRDPRYAEAAVEQALLTALVDPDTGLLGANVIRIGQGVYESQIAAACLAVSGVAAVQSISFAPALRVFFGLRFGAPTSEALRHDPGIGNYFVVPNDADHVSLVGVVS